MSRVIIGIDPGLGGAFAALVGERPVFFDVPIVRSGKRNEVSAAALAMELTKWEDEYGELRAVLELVGPMPRDSRVGAFKFGDTYGQIKAVLSVLAIPYDLVRPQRWKQDMGIAPKSPKDASIGRAIQLYPRIASYLNLKKHHNRADALLIAEYGKRHIFTETTIKRKRPRT